MLKSNALLAYLNLANARDATHMSLEAKELVLDAMDCIWRMLTEEETNYLNSLVNKEE